MSPATPFRYLLGSRDAIQTLTRWRWTVLLGLLLVATAGVARHYDDVHGLVGFRWLIGPIVVSMISSIVVYCLVNSALHFSRHLGCGMDLGYWRFLGLFWMTAPCAWLYAIPVEHWNDSLGAAKWNVAFLAIVSLWRVALIARASFVICGGSPWRAISAVILPAGCEFAVVSWLLGLGRSIATSMGGIRELDPRDEFLAAVHSTGITIGVLLFFVGLIGLLSTDQPDDEPERS